VGGTYGRPAGGSDCHHEHPSHDTTTINHWDLLTLPVLPRSIGIKGLCLAGNRWPVG
jgi:hypothetical protein